MRIALIIFLIFCLAGHFSAEDKMNLNRLIESHSDIICGAFTDASVTGGRTVLRFGTKKIIKGYLEEKEFYLITGDISDGMLADLKKYEYIIFAAEIYKEDKDLYEISGKEEYRNKAVFRSFDASGGMYRFIIHKTKECAAFPASAFDPGKEPGKNIYEENGVRYFAVPLKTLTEISERGAKENRILDKKIRKLFPKDKKFRFKPPKSYGSNEMYGAVIKSVSEGESGKDAYAIIDGQPATTWKSVAYYKKPEILIDLKEEKKFNTVVIFNRYTDMRGTGGGNNAAKRIEIYISPSEDESGLRLYALLDLEGPIPQCITYNERRCCFFIDRTAPQIFRKEDATARLILLKFIDAHWAEKDIPDNWRSSFSLSEIMLFNDSKAP